MGIIIVAIKRETGEMEFNPKSTSVIRQGDTLSIPPVPVHAESFREAEWNACVPQSKTVTRQFQDVSQYEKMIILVFLPLQNL